MRKKTNKIHYVFSAFLFSLIFFGLGCGSQSTNNGGLFISLDFGDEWHDRNFIEQNKKSSVGLYDVTIKNLTFSPDDPAKLYAGTGEAGLFFSDNDGNQWQRTGLNQGSITAVAVDTKTPETLYAVRGREVLKSTDSAVTWEVVYTQTGTPLVKDLIIDWFNPSKLYLATSDGNIVTTDDGGETWEILHTFKGYKLNDLIIDPADSRIIYAVLDSFFFQKSVDGGKSWKDFSENLSKTNPGLQVIDHIIVDPLKHDHLFASSLQMGLVESQNGGETWDRISTLLTQQVIINAIAVDPLDSRNIYFTVGNLIHKTVDGGKSWQTIETFPSPRPIIMLMIHPTDPSVLYAGTLKVVEKNGFFL